MVVKTMLIFTHFFITTRVSDLGCMSAKTAAKRVGGRFGIPNPHEYRIQTQILLHPKERNTQAGDNNVFNRILR